jgi:hypothetical protein
MPHVLWVAIIDKASRMTKKNRGLMMEWLRPAGIGIAIFIAFYLGKDAISRFHIMGPFVVMLMSGTVAFESLILGEVASEKIGYKLNRVLLRDGVGQ